MVPSVTQPSRPPSDFLASLAQATGIPVWSTRRTGTSTVPDPSLPGICSLIRETAAGRRCCADSYRRALQELAASGRSSILYSCHAGLSFITALLSEAADGESCIVVGRCPMGEVDGAALEKLAGLLGLDPGALLGEASRLRPVSKGQMEGVQSHLELLMQGGDAVRRYREEATSLRMELAALAQVGVRLGNVLPTGLLLEELLQLAVEMLDAGAGLIVLPDEKSGRLRVLAPEGCSELLTDFRHLALRSPEPRSVLASGEPIMVPSQGVEDRLASLGRPGSSGLGSVFWVPMKSAGEVVGVLGVGCREPGSARESMLYFTLLQLLAVQGGVAIKSAALQQELLEKERLATRLLDATIHAQEEERERICLEIHDGVAQTLVAALRHTEAVGGELGDRLGEMAEPLERATSLVRASLREVREIIGSLRPATLDTLGLVPTLRQTLSQLERELGWQTELVSAPLRLSKEMETMLYRILQEAITNARKHSETHRLRVQLELKGQQVVAEVRDWGKGFVLSRLPVREGKRKSVGLLSMRKRSELLGGRCEVTSAPGRGTVVRVELPLLGGGRIDGADFRLDS